MSKLKIVIYYHNDEALEEYLAGFREIIEECEQTGAILTGKYGQAYDLEYVTIECIKGVGESCRARRAHIIMVQEELTWREDWHDLKRNVLSPALLWPTGVRIFSGRSELEDDE